MLPIMDTIRSRSWPLMTWAIILINAGVFFYELSLPPEQLEYLISRLGMVPTRLGSDPNAYWALLTCMFLHGGWIHFIGNMWALFLFGDNVEDRLGSVRYLFFYLLSGVAAGLTHYLTNLNSPVPTIGASGAIAGVLGAYIVLYPRSRVITLVPVFFIPFLVEIPAYFYLGAWFVSQILRGVLSLVDPHSFEGVAWWAHVGGFVAGIALLFVFEKSRTQYQHFYADEYWPW